MVSAAHLADRLNRFRKHMDSVDSKWELAAVFGKVNTYYFTGTMQNGALLIPRNADAIYYVRKSFDRAKIESNFPNIIKMGSFRDVAAELNLQCKSIHIEKELLPFAVFERFNKYFGFSDVRSADFAIAKTRAVKDTFELDLMGQAGKIHEEVMENVTPGLLKIGMSEAELGSLVTHEMILRGHQGIVRMGSFNAELYLGNVCFGENGNYFNSFDGPGGLKGVSPAVPLFGSFVRKLQESDILYVDSGCGVDGYHTDKTVVYAMGNVPSELKTMHQQCVDIQYQVAEMLVPGAIPSEIYKKVTESLNPEFDQNFMGFESNKVKFLAHGIGLVIDEYPVVAKGFDEPIEENMVFAIEPKKCIADIGMVGIENTFVVTPTGGKSITGNNTDIVQV